MVFFASVLFLSFVSNPSLRASPCTKLMGQATGAKSLQQLDSVGIRLAMDSAANEAKDWGDVATVFGSHTKPPFYKSAMVCTKRVV